MTRRMFREELNEIIARDKPGFVVANPEEHPSRVKREQHLRAGICLEAVEAAVGKYPLLFPEEYPSMQELAAAGISRSHDVVSVQTRAGPMGRLVMLVDLGKGRVTSAQG